MAAEELDDQLVSIAHTYQCGCVVTTYPTGDTVATIAMCDNMDCAIKHKFNEIYPSVEMVSPPRNN